MATLLLYSASISQIGASTPSVSIAADKAAVSGSWSRLATGFYKFAVGSGSAGFSSISGSISGILGISTIQSSTASYSLYISGSDSSSLYLNTYSSDNTLTAKDNCLSGSSSNLQVSVTIVY